MLAGQILIKDEATQNFSLPNYSLPNYSLPNYSLPNYSLKNARLHFTNTIDAIEVKNETSKNNSDLIILPGFIDTHVHGGDGADTMDGEESIGKLAAYHLKHGTTTLYPTTITNPWLNIISALNAVKTISQLQKVNELKNEHQLPSIPGAHLEGPFISPQRLGAQPDFAIIPTPEKVEELLKLDIIKLLTIAPEIPQAIEAAKSFAKTNCRISIGHTNATAEAIEPFVQAVRDEGGTIGYTHLFNAMGGMTAREPNALGSALADTESYAEIILDNHHVHTTSFLAALQAKATKLSLITDAIRASGTDAVESELGGQKVYLKDGKATLANSTDGTLAGSLLTMDLAFKNAIAAGLSVATASQLASKTPASYMGLTDRGTLDVGKRADIIVMNKAFDILEVYVNGKRLV